MQFIDPPELHKENIADIKFFHNLWKAFMKAKGRFQ